MGLNQQVWMWPNWGYSTSRSFNESATYDVATVAPTPRGTLSIVDPDAEENARSRLSPLPTVCGTVRRHETSSGLSLACGRIVPQSYLLLSKQLEFAEEIERESDKATTYGDSGE
jgi:hypothetical protein